MPSKKPLFFGIHADSQEAAERILFDSGKPYANPKKEAELRESMIKKIADNCPIKEECPHVRNMERRSPG